MMATMAKAAVHQQDHGAAGQQLAYEVQQLFETRTIEDIRKIDSTTRKDVEDKRQELRKLIGARYRDLISSADSIVVMKQNADSLFSRISSMRADLQSSSSATTHPTGVAVQTPNLWSPPTLSVQAKEEKSRKALHFATASKVKTILETPELIWTALEREKHLEATLLYHQAQVLHAALRADPTGARLLDAMPVAPRQWAIVCQFPAKIDSASKAFLTRPDQPPEQKPAPSQIFSEFLESRTHLIETLTRTGASSYDKDTIIQRLRGGINAIISAFFLVFYIFTCPTSQPNPKNLKLLVPTVNHKESPSHFIKHAHSTHLHSSTPPTPPYFYSTLQTIKDDLDAIHKTHALENTEDAGSLAFFSLHIPSASVHTQSEQWLKNNAERFHIIARDMLAHVNGAQILAHVRDSVRSAMEEVIGTADVAWETVSQAVLGTNVDLWEVLCADVLSTRAREIVAHSLQNVNFESALTTLLRTPSAGVGVGLWSPETARDDKDVATIQSKAAGLTPGVSEFVRKFDTMLAACLSDLAHLTQQASPPSTPLPPPSPRIVPQSPSKFSTPSIVPNASNAVVNAANNQHAANNQLEAYVQDRCFAGVSTFLEMVKKRLEVLQANIVTLTSNASSPASIPMIMHQQTALPTATEEEARRCVDEALVTAQAARALSTFSKQLAAALVPATPAQPTNSTPISVSQSTPTLRRTKPQLEKEDPAVNARLVAIKSSLRQCYLRGYVLWAKWVTATHVQWLGACVQRDSWSDSVRLQGWEEHKVVIEGEEGPMDEKLYLPFQPSPYVLEFLFAVCQEIHRAGGHTVHRTALEYLARELATAVLDLYDGVAQTLHGSASKEGGVQLLCDACFLIDVLSVPDSSLFTDEDLRTILPSPATVTTADTATEGRYAQAIAWGRRVDKTVDTLKDLLDPIDLAFYEAHVKSFVTRCYQRCSVLFGALVQLHRQDGHTKIPPITEPHIIPLAKPTARFGYLPTSVPAPNTTHTPSKHLNATPGAEVKESGKKLSLMEQGVGSLKKFTSLNMLASQFGAPTSPQPSQSGTAARLGLSSLFS